MLATERASSRASAMTLSTKLFDEASRLFPGGVNSPVRAWRNVDGTPLFIVRARGATITDADGRTYRDFVGSWGAAIAGHAHPRVVRAVEIRSPTVDRLLYDFLTELIVIKDVDSLLFKDFKVSIASGLEHRLSCEMRGEEIDRERHGLRNDVKAVTMHMFGVKKAGGGAGGWEVTVVLDI